MATLHYKDTAIPVGRGTDLLGAVLTAGKPIAYLCMSGSCGMCRVTVVSGADQLAELGPAERYHCKGSTGKDGEPRLACQAIALGDGDIHISQ